MIFINKKIPYNQLEFLMFKIDEFSDELISKGKDVIKLTLGKSELPLDEEIKKVFVEKIYDPYDSLLVYPEGLPELKDAIKKYYLQFGIDKFETKNIIINTGTSPLFKIIFDLLVERGNEILLPKPYYSVYFFSSYLSHAKIKFYDINSKTKKIDMDSFRKNFSSDKTKLVILNSPGNPFGNIISPYEYEQILDIVNEKSFILSDEIYWNTYFGDRPKSILEIAEKYNNIIVANGFSKGFRMYAKRLGFLIIPDNLIQPFRVFQQHTLLTVDPVVQFAGIKALERKQDVEELNRIYKKRVDYTIEKLKDISEISMIIPEGGFYMTLLCHKYMTKNKIMTSLELVEDILINALVGVVPGSDFGIDKALRLSFTNSRFEEAIDRLNDYFRK